MYCTYCMYRVHGYWLVKFGMPVSLFVCILTVLTNCIPWRIFFGYPSLKTENSATIYSLGKTHHYYWRFPFHWRPSWTSCLRLQILVEDPNISWETVKFSLEIPYFRKIPPYFHWRPHIYIGDPHFRGRTLYFHWRLPNFHWKLPNFHWRSPIFVG